MTMQRYFGVCMLLVGLGLLAFTTQACLFSSVSGNKHFDAAATTDPGATKLKGQSCAHVILGLVAVGDASLEKAMENAGASGKVVRNVSVDKKLLNIIGLYVRYCTVVSAEYDGEDEPKPQVGQAQPVQRAQAKVQTPAPRFERRVDSGEAVFVDRSTWRTWQISSGGRATWAEARDYCRSLFADGQEDWRLPTLDELRSLVTGCPTTQASGSCRVSGNDCSEQSCVDSNCTPCQRNMGPNAGCYWHEDVKGSCSRMWSSTSQSDDRLKAWTINFSDASIEGISKATKAEVRCVR